MIEKEAAVILKTELKFHPECSTFGEALDMAVQALEEIQEYRAIGTAGECRAAVEKIKPKKPEYEGDGYFDGKIVYDTWICPGCGKDYEMEYENYDYCPNCGQAIRWNNNLEEMEDE